MLTLSHSSNPIIYDNLLYRDLKNAKKLNNVWNQNVNVTKRASFTTFSISMADDLWLQQMYRWNTIKIWFPRLIINVLHGSNFMTILYFFIGRWKNLPLSRGYFGRWGHANNWWPLLLQRGFNKSKCMDCPPRQNKVAIVERRLLVEV